MTLGSSGWLWVWDIAIKTQYHYKKLSFLFPALFIIGFGLFLFPTYVDERIARGEDISKLSGKQLITDRWWVITLLAAIIGGSNFLIIASLLWK